MSKIAVNELDTQSGSNITVTSGKTLTVASGIVAGGLTYPTSDGSANAALITNGSGTLSFSSINELVDDRVDSLITDGEGITTTYDDSAGTLSIAAEEATDSNKGVASFASADFSVSSGAVSLVDLTISHMAAATVVLESEGIGSNDNDTTIPTSAAVKDYVDTQVASEDTLAEMNDTNISTPADGALLFYDNDSSLWIDNVVSGDITILDTGVASISSGVIIDTDIKSDAAIDATKIADGSVTSTEFQYLGTVTSSIQTQLDAKGVGDVTGASTTTFTNKTFDANGTGNALTNVDIGNMTAEVIVTESEGISSNDNDTTIPTSAAVKDAVDTAVAGAGGASVGLILALG